MFLKQYQFSNNNIRNIYYLFKRNYNFKKLSLQADKNPHVKNVLEEQTKKREEQGVLRRLIDKRTSEYKEYFSHSSDPSILKRPKHTSYDHIGQKRAVHLSKILRSFLTDRIGSGEIGDILAGKDFQLTNIIVPVDLNRIEILWWSPEQERNIIEDLLKTAGEELRTAIRHAQLLPNLPPVIFKRDNLRKERDEINHLLDTADMGSSDEISSTTAIDNQLTERKDLYDSDRTIILQKLSIDADVNNEEENDISQLTVEQMQQRMKAFALTKRMKRVKEQKDAMYGIMAIEKERQNQEHFSLNEMTDFEFGQEKKIK